MSQPLHEESIKVVDSEYQLAFDLTPRQLTVSHQLALLVSQHKSVLLEAVCGAGKTELVYETIAQQLSLGYKVGFAIARRQVVLEIAERLGSVFRKLKVVAVCQGHTADTVGDLIVCTTHQLYRYRRYFDLLILDEPDAFPYKGNPTLQGFSKNACKGSFVYLTATPDEHLRRMVAEGQLSYLYLSKRPSGQNLPVPVAHYGSRTVLYIWMLFLLRKLYALDKPIIVFAPTIRIGRQLYRLLKLFLPTVNIDSTVTDKDEKIKAFRQGTYRVCVSTTVLERGITIPHVNIIVMFADGEQYDESSLTQMAGRVGRSVQDPFGYCYFLAIGRSRSIDNCIRSIKRANDD